MRQRDFLYGDSNKSKYTISLGGDNLTSFIASFFWPKRRIGMISH